MIAIIIIDISYDPSYIMLIDHIISWWSYNDEILDVTSGNLLKSQLYQSDHVIQVINIIESLLMITRS